MRFTFCLELDDWELLDPVTQQTIVGRVVAVLRDANVAWLSRGARFRSTPSLYDSGVTFEREPDGALNLWQNLPRALARGRAHCVALAAWRSADLQVRYGEPAQIEVLVGEEMRPVVGRQQEFHIVVRRADGSREDPSRLLGMP